jgi:CheY-like chemotaxis protein
LKLMPNRDKPLNILLAEDDDGDAKAVQRSFLKSKIGNPILRAVDGRDALDMLKGLSGKTRTSPPRIVIADLNMPRMNGIQLVKAIREDPDEEVRNTIVFILTTSSRVEDKSAVYEHKIAGYIVKATAGRDFLELVKLMDCYGRLVDLP